MKPSVNRVHTAQNTAFSRDCAPMQSPPRSVRIVRPMQEPDLTSPEAQAAMKHVHALLGFIGDDPTREGLLDTPKRVVNAMYEHFWGYGADPMEPLSRTFTEIEGYDELVLLQDIEIHSHCEHHMVPFVGKAHVAYIPNGRIVGLSKIPRVVDAFARRLQVQERLTTEILNCIQDTLKPLGVAVVIEAQHMCMVMRGIQKQHSVATTSAFTGGFEEEKTRAEFIRLITRGND